MGKRTAEDFFVALDPAKAEEFVRERLERNIDLFKDTGTSGFYSALAAFLFFKYWELGSHPVVFSRAYYPFIILHLFCPPDRIHEQFVFLPFSPRPMKCTSVLTQIAYDVRACLYYHQGLKHGRRKYLKYFNQPLISEIFKGLEYLARLYSVSLDEFGSYRRFETLVRACSQLPKDLIMALWRFRCGIVHAGTLYNTNQHGTYRFGFSLGMDEPIIVDDTAQRNSFLQGKHFKVSLFSLAELFVRASEFLLVDMQANFTKYAMHQQFPRWVQQHLSIQYLTSAAEGQQISALYPRATDEQKSNRSNYAFSKCYVPFWYVWRLNFKRKLDDARSWLRDALTR